MHVRRCDPGAMTKEARLEEAAGLLLRGALRLLQDSENPLDEDAPDERPCDDAVDAAPTTSKEVA